MQKPFTISLLTVAALTITGCTQSPSAPSVPSAPAVDTLIQQNTDFAATFAACEADQSKCDLNRKETIQGTITNIRGPNEWDISNYVDVLNNQWQTITIPVLPDSQQKRQTILINQVWENIWLEDIQIWDAITAKVQRFDRIEDGQLEEKLWQYGWIQITRE